MMEYGEKVTQDQTDAQYMFLREVRCGGFFIRLRKPFIILSRHT